MQLLYPTEFPRWETFADNTRALLNSIEEFNQHCQMYGEPIEYKVVRIALESRDQVSSIIDETERVIEEAIALVKKGKGCKKPR